MEAVDLPQDYKDLLNEFLACGVEFLLTGGWAVAAHGHGGATDDMDVFVHATPDNAIKVFEALQRFGAPVIAHLHRPTAAARSGCPAAIIMH